MTVSARLIGEFESGKSVIMTSIGEITYLTDDINDIYVFTKEGSTYLHYIEEGKGPRTVKLTNTTSWYTKIRDWECKTGSDIFGNTIHYLAPNYGIFIKVPENEKKPILVFNKD